jgi:hypothetical protein
MTVRTPVALLASAPACFTLGAPLRRHGYDVHSWFLPERYPPEDAAALASQAGDWREMLARCPITVTAFDAENILNALVPHFVANLPQGAVWLQLGPASRQRVQQHAVRAQRADVAVFNLPLGSPPTLLARGWPDGSSSAAETEAEIVYGLIAAAVLERVAPSCTTTTATERTDFTLWTAELAGGGDPKARSN